MALEEGFWAPGLEGTTERMNLCVLVFGPVADIPAASEATKGRRFFATDDKVLYFDNGTDMVKCASFDHDELDGLASGDAHTQYQKVSEKGAGSGYASLDGDTKVPYAECPTGVDADTLAIGDHTHGGAILQDETNPTASYNPIHQCYGVDRVQVPASSTAILDTVTVNLSVATTVHGYLGGWFADEDNIGLVFKLYIDGVEKGSGSTGFGAAFGKLSFAGSKACSSGNRNVTYRVRNNDGGNHFANAMCGLFAGVTEP